MAKSSCVALCCCLVSLTLGARRKPASEIGLRMTSRVNHAEIKTDNHIVCPVLAALHKAGALKTDSNGDFEIQDLYDALHYGLGIRDSLASFQAYGIVVYDKSQKGIEEHRNPGCKPPATSCFLERTVLGEVNDTTRRWVNLYDMNGKQALEHGISTGVRGGDTNMPQNAVDCGGEYPCRKRFDQFFNGVVSNDRFYLNDIMKIVCKARKYGDRGGELAYAKRNTLLGIDTDMMPGREWQMRGAFGNLLTAFGRKDSSGTLYLTLADFEALMMEGRYPDGWTKRVHGCVVLGCDSWDHTAIDLFNMDVPCDVDYDTPFWQGTGCDVYTGRTCGIFSGCRHGEVCVGGKCICGRGGSLRTMCFESGACREPSSDNYTWFGSPRRIVPADNPTPRGNPE